MDPAARGKHAFSIAEDRRRAFIISYHYTILATQPDKQLQELQPRMEERTGQHIEFRVHRAAVYAVHLILHRERKSDPSSAHRHDRYELRSADIAPHRVRQEGRHVRA